MLNPFLVVFSSLNSHGVKYLVIGGIAAIAHGVPRETPDLDILIEPTLANADHLLIALNDAGFFKAPPPTCAELLEQAVTPYTDRECVRRIDVHTHMERASFEKAWQRKPEMTYKCQAFTSCPAKI